MSDSSSDGSGERLQKVLARAGVASRRRVEEMVEEGRITVNGRLAVPGQRIDLASDAVKVDGRRIVSWQGERRYFLLNKPAGYVSTLEDPEGRPTVMSLLPQRLRKGLVPVGRLDYETEGLMILTDDGEFAQHIAHPRYGCTKVYEAKIKGRPQEAAIARLREGIVLYGKRTAPAHVKPLYTAKGARDSVSNSWWTVKLGEGKTRQIREMFFRIGHPVNRLRRVAIGPVSDPRLPRGTWRELTEREIEALRKRTAQPVAKPKPGRRPVGESKPPRAKPAVGKSPRGKNPRSQSPGGKNPGGKNPRSKNPGGKNPRSTSPHSRPATGKPKPKGGGRGGDGGRGRDGGRGGRGGRRG